MRILIGVVLGSILVTSVVVGGGTAQALTSTTHPQLSLNHLIQTSPFPAPNRMFDNEGSAYVADDDALWMADDQADALFEVDRTTGALRRKIPQSAFINALPVGGGDIAGETRNDDLEALAYDADDDVLYAFSGSTPVATANPTVYRLTRDGNEQFQVESWQAVASESAGAGWRAADGLTYVANNSAIRTYDWATNTFGTPFSIPELTNIVGIDFDDETGDLLAVNNVERLYRASMTTLTLRPGWTGISLTGLGLLDTRAVEVIGEQVLVTDGQDPPVRPAAAPESHAVFVIDVTADTTDPTVAVVTPSGGAVYARNRVVNAEFSCADEAGGSGLASCVGTVAHGAPIDTATVGDHPFTVTGTDNEGNETVVSRTYTVANGRPDARIRRGTGPVVGNNVYNGTGLDQTRTGAAGRAQSVTYPVSVQNDALFAEQLRVQGQGSTTRFTVQYRDPANVNITAQVLAGSYRTPVLAAGAIYTIRAVVTPKAAAPANASVARTVTATSNTHPAVKDTVKFVTTRT